MHAAVDQLEREGATQGVGEFLAHHEGCGSGFEIIRNGRGKLHLLCGGCGEDTRYGAADVEQLRAHGIDTTQAAGGRRFRPGRESVERWLPAPAALPWWIPNAYIFAVILIGLGMVAFGVLRPRDENRAVLDEPSPSTQTAPAPEPAPAPPAPVEAGSAGNTAPEQPKVPPARKSAKPPELDRVSVLGRFAVGTPPSWERGMSGGAVVFSAPDGNAELRVFLESGGRPLGRLADDAAGYLEREHPGAKVGPPERIRLGETRAVRLIARYPGGEEWAALLSAGGYSYLVLSQADGDAPASLRAASVAALRSFRPL